MWKFVRDESGGSGSNCGWVDRLQGPDTPSQPNGLGEALDTSLEFTRGGDSFWNEYTSTYYYDNDAVQSSDIDDNEQVWFQTTVELDAQETLSFWWRVSSHYSDGLEFYSGPDPNNLVRRYRISGDQNWQQKTYTLAAGTHVLKWAYVKDGWTSSGSDCGWVDLVQLSGFGPIDVRIATEDDDAEESASGSVDLGSSDLELVYDGSNQTVGLRFTNLAIPQGAEIGSAYIEFTADETNSGNCDLMIQAEDIDDAPAFSSQNSNLSNRTKTTAQVSWSPDSWGSVWAKHQTSDIASVIQEVIDRPGWSSGNDLVILITGTGERTAESYDGSSSKAPLLHIEAASKLESDPPPTQWEKVTYKYDPSGRRIAKHIDNDYTITYAYDGGSVLAEYNGEGNMLRKYIYGPGVDQPICMIEAAENNAAYYYHFDGLGSVIALSDEDGNSVQTYEYSIYGQTGANNPNDPNAPDHPNPYMFTGRRFDVETGLYYYRARYYDPHTGRFLQTDPIGYEDGINWYAYCRNNPGNMVDPSGRSAEDEDGPVFYSPYYDPEEYDLARANGQEWFFFGTNRIAIIPGRFRLTRRGPGEDFDIPDRYIIDFNEDDYAKQLSDLLKYFQRRRIYKFKAFGEIMMTDPNHYNPDENYYDPITKYWVECINFRGFTTRGEPSDPTYPYRTSRNFGHAKDAAMWCIGIYTDDDGNHSAGYPYIPPRYLWSEEMKKLFAFRTIIKSRNNG